MRIPRFMWPGVFLLCILCISEGAVLRPYRHYDLLDDLDNNLKTTGRTNVDLFPDNAQVPVFPTATNSFQPTFQRCCQIGKRVAKKKMVCDITVLAVLRKYNYESRKYSIQHSKKRVKHSNKNRLNKLSEKIAKCSAVHPKHFVTCCMEHEEFAKVMKKCQLKPRRQRKRCKQIVKKRFS